MAQLERPEGHRDVDKARVFVPVKESDWRDKVEYAWDPKTSFGTFFRAEGVGVFAPERGNIFPRPDGGLVILVPAGPGEEVDRQWLLGPVKFAKPFKNGDIVEAGELLGDASDDELKLAFFVAPKGGSNFTPGDPADVLQRSGAAFPDDKDDKAPAPRGKSADPIGDVTKKKYDFSDLLIAGGLSIFGGMALGYGIKK